MSTFNRATKVPSFTLQWNMCLRLWSESHMCPLIVLGLIVFLCCWKTVVMVLVYWTQTFVPCASFVTVTLRYKTTNQWTSQSYARTVCVTMCDYTTSLYWGSGGGRCQYQGQYLSLYVNQYSAQNVLEKYLAVHVTTCKALTTCHLPAKEKLWSDTNALFQPYISRSASALASSGSRMNSQLTMYSGVYRN